MDKRKILPAVGVSLTFAAVVGACSSVAHATMSEEMLEKFAQNNILFYDPYGSNACVEAGSSNYQVVDPSDYYYSADDNASGLMGSLMENGYSQQSAAAILGNLYWESNLNPRVLEGGAIVAENFRAWDGGKTYSGGFGLAQWTYESRVQALQEYADSRNLPVTSIQAQVGYLVQELNDPYYGCSPGELNSLDLAGAVNQVWRKYENPATDDFQRRYEKAGEFLGIAPGDLPEVVDTGDPSTGSNGVVNCVPEDEDGGGGGYSGGPGNPVTADGVVSFSQCDPAWGNLNYGNQGINGHDMNSICESGCGPTSFASILATMGMSVTPADTADVAGRAGMHVRCAGGDLCGSSWEISNVLANHYGLHAQNLGNASVETINAALRAGKMIHAVGAGGYPFTEGGHYVAIVGITDSGEWIVADSAGSHDQISSYDPYQVTAGLSNAYAISK